MKNVAGRLPGVDPGFPLLTSLMLPAMRVVWIDGDLLPSKLRAEKVRTALQCCITMLFERKAGSSKAASLHICIGHGQSWDPTDIGREDRVSGACWIDKFMCSTDVVTLRGVWEHA